MKTPIRLGQSEMGEVIRLANELHAFPGPCRWRDRHLLRRILDLTGGRAGLIGVLRGNSHPLVLRACVHDGRISDEQYADGIDLARLLKPETLVPPEAARLKPMANGSVTRRHRRRAGVGPNAAARVQPPFPLTGENDVLTSVAVVRDGIKSVVVIEGTTDGTGFSETHCRIVELIHSGIGWMFPEAATTVSAGVDADRTASGVTLREVS